MLIVVVLGFNIEDERQGFGVQPGRREDVRASLALEEQSKPEGKSCATRWHERVDWALQTWSIVRNCRCRLWNAVWVDMSVLLHCTPSRLCKPSRRLPSNSNSLMAYTEKLQALQALARHHGDLLHLGHEGDLRGRQAPRERKSHGRQSRSRFRLDSGWQLTGRVSRDVFSALFDVLAMLCSEISTSMYPKAACLRRLHLQCVL